MLSELSYDGNTVSAEDTAVETEMDSSINFTDAAKYSYFFRKHVLTVLLLKVM